MVIRDGDWKLFDYDYQTGRSVWMLDTGNETVFRVDYPIDATVAENERVRNAASKAWKGDYHLIASVPLNLFHDENIGLGRALNEGDNKHVSKFLNDSDNRAWRTKEGRV